MPTILVTGGAGFIGSALVRQLIVASDYRVVTIDKLTYAGNLESLGDALHHPRHTFVRADICDADALRTAFIEHRPVALFHLAAESHVDRSIDGPSAFVQTNFVGTYTLLQEVAAALECTCRTRSPKHSVLCMCRQMKCSARCRRTGYSPSRLRTRRDHPTRRPRPEFRPSRARVAARLWIARHHHKLQQQLRPISISRKTHPAHHSQSAVTEIRSQYTAAERTYATGYMSMTTLAPSDSLLRGERQVRLTTSANARSERTSKWFAMSARCLDRLQPRRTGQI